MPLANSADSFPAIVTRPGFLGCLNWRWLPRVRTRCQPSLASSARTSRTFISASFERKAWQPLSQRLALDERHDVVQEAIGFAGVVQRKNVGMKEARLVYNIVQICTIIRMTFHSFLATIGDLPFFDLATVVQLAGERRTTVQTQLGRWVRSGRLVPLRRGMYALAQRYRRTPVNTAELANHLYRPSYLSREWALGYYGLILEKVVTYTSTTSRVPRRFENAFGTFEYRHVKRAAFFGYRALEMQGRKVLLAEPTKALLDLWHLTSGPWTADRMVEMRFQNFGAVNQEELREYAARFGSPRLLRATDVWCELAEAEQEGGAAL